MVKQASVGIQQLIDRTGPTGSRIKATVVVDQVYAQDQHETLHYIHPHGGGPKYLETPLMQDHRMWIEDFAQRVLNARRPLPQLWGDLVGKPLVRAVPRHAPKKFGNLGFSASLTVTEGGAIHSYEPPAKERMSRAELDVIDEIRPDRLHKRGGI